MNIHIETTAPYIPGKNTILYSSCIDEPIENVTASFCYLFVGNNKILLANNRKCGLEIPGGHVEPNETPRQASIREAQEETGVVIKKLHGYVMTAKHTCLFDKPENYNYPYPISYMNFYIAKNCNYLSNTFVETEECKKPELIEYGVHDTGITLFPTKRQEDVVHDFLNRNPFFNIFAKQALET